jgi:pantetheine-phosphate adenylyltransferase
MEKIALLAGSFDPITKGHEALVRRALPMFDHIVVAIGENTQKQCLFTLAQRMEWISRTFSDTTDVKVASYKGLTTDFCHQQGIQYLLRGIRGNADFLYEENIAHINRTIAPDIENIFLLSDVNEDIISSTMIRELLTFGHDISEFVPKAICNDVVAANKKRNPTASK